MSTVEAKTVISIEARVHRINWDRRPTWISKGIWLWLGSRRIWGTGDWENLGQIASSKDGSASLQPITS